MRTIERTGQFKRDYKRTARGRYRATLDADLVPVLVALANDHLLEPRHRDHALTGEWKDYRDCHVKPDSDTLRLVRLGSHSELGL
ncbi:MAG: type II toxin-antitoxin system YafQ family toxin [Deltaproteobacteria bacterium]|nr:type II toxin-antitoxin system YafQ family toxin [Deltaproteobacteria bacterium]